MPTSSRRARLVWFGARGRNRSTPDGGRFASNEIACFRLSCPTTSLAPRPCPDANGIARVSIPALGWSRPLVAQTLVLSPDPGYAPQSFTNVTRL
ncbi:MAG: hypothetical protein H6832_00610 [Planctomycetes bacterium]|nr:hypothetical protein [Planctomycetota bacterium]